MNAWQSDARTLHFGDVLGAQSPSLLAFLWLSPVFQSRQSTVVILWILPPGSRFHEAGILGPLCPTELPVTQEPSALPPHRPHGPPGHFCKE